MKRSSPLPGTGPAPGNRKPALLRALEVSLASASQLRLSAQRAAQKALLEERAWAMRHSPTQTEALMWRLLRGRRLLGVQFRRQVVLGDHIVDFVAREASLIVEIDGDARHQRQLAHDAARDRKLARRGFRVLRIPASLVEQDLVGATALVIQALLEARE